MSCSALQLNAGKVCSMHNEHKTDLLLVRLQRKVLTNIAVNVYDLLIVYGYIILATDLSPCILSHRGRLQIPAHLLLLWSRLLRSLQQQPRRDAQTVSTVSLFWMRQQGQGSVSVLSTSPAISLTGPRCTPAPAHHCSNPLQHQACQLLHTVTVQESKWQPLQSLHAVSKTL